MKKTNDRVAPKSKGKATVIPKTKDYKNPVSHFKEYNQKDTVADVGRNFVKGLDTSIKLNRAERMHKIPKDAKMKDKTS